MRFGKYDISNTEKHDVYWLQVNENCKERQGEGMPITDKDLEGLLDEFFRKNF